jgi:hypothetical protein
VSKPDEQPWVDWPPFWDEPLSKIPTLDIKAVRAKLAGRFNVRPPKVGRDEQRCPPPRGVRR